MDDAGLPTADDVRAARDRIAGRVHRTPVMTSRTLDERMSASVFLKCESLQRGGAFKLRGALNAVLQLSDEQAARGVATHSSGNHGAALALAGAARGIPVTVVMPSDTPQAKIDAVRGYGARVVECGTSLPSRRIVLDEVLAETGAHEVHPSDDPRVIAGAGTACLELMDEVPDLDLVIAPVSGGGLISGTALAAHGVDPSCRVWGAEPAGVDDAARSLAAGELITTNAGTTIADGLRSNLSARTFAVIRRHVEGIVTVTDDQIVEAMRFLFGRCKLVVEPSGATGLAGALELRATGLDPWPHRIGVILSGGNLDLDRLPFVG
jgi:threonine dehydratase